MCLFSVSWLAEWLTGSGAATGSWRAAARRPRPRRCPGYPYCFAPRSRHASRGRAAVPSRHPRCGLRPRPFRHPSRLQK